MIFTATMVLFYAWQAGDGYQLGSWAEPTTLFGPEGQASVERLRTTYEEQIRQAASQEERNRLARDLHDSIKQQIFAIHTSAAIADARFGADDRAPGRPLPRCAHPLPETLLAAVRAVARGRTYIAPAVARHVLEASAGGRQDDLTPREVEVLRHVALGRSNKEIAEALFISEETVKTHVGHLLGTLQVENRAQAIVQALKRGVVGLEELE